VDFLHDASRFYHITINSQLIKLAGKSILKPSLLQCRMRTVMYEDCKVKNVKIKTEGPAEHQYLYIIVFRGA